MAHGAVALAKNRSARLHRNKDAKFQNKRFTFAGCLCVGSGNMRCSYVDSVRMIGFLYEGEN